MYSKNEIPPRLRSTRSVVHGILTEVFGEMEICEYPPKVENVSVPDEEVRTMLQESELELEIQPSLGVDPSIAP